MRLIIKITSGILRVIFKHCLWIQYGSFFIMHLLIILWNKCFGDNNKPNEIPFSRDFQIDNILPVIIARHIHYRS